MLDGLRKIYNDWQPYAPRMEVKIPGIGVGSGDKVEQGRQFSRRDLLKALLKAAPLSFNAKSFVVATFIEGERMVEAMTKTEYMLPKETMYYYDQAFEKCLEQIPDTIENDTSPIWKMLCEARKFKNQHMGWARIENGKITPLRGVDQNKKIFVAVLQQQDERFSAQPNMFQISDKPGENVLYLKPSRITEEWAAIMLGHELVHLYDHATGREQKGQIDTDAKEREFLKGEVRAYLTQFAVADLISEGKYGKAIEKILDKFGIEKVNEFFGYIDNKDHCLYEIYADMDKAITRHKAESEDENGVRIASHNVAVCFAIIARQNAPSIEKEWRRTETLKWIFRKFWHQIETQRSK